MKSRLVLTLHARIDALWAAVMAGSNDDVIMLSDDDVEDIVKYIVDFLLEKAVENMEKEDVQETCKYVMGCIFFYYYYREEEQALLNNYGIV